MKRNPGESNDTNSMGREKIQEKKWSTGSKVLRHKVKMKAEIHVLDVNKKEVITKLARAASVE